MELVSQEGTPQLCTFPISFWREMFRFPVYDLTTISGWTFAMSNVISFPDAIDERRKVCLELLDKLEVELGRVGELIDVCPEEATRARLARHRASLQELVTYAKRQALAI